MADIHYLFTPMTKKADLLPNRIRQLRGEKGMTIVELAARVGTSKQMMGMLERGDRALNLEWQRRIARALGCSPGDLLLAADNPWGALTSDERTLLEQYRALDAVGRRAVRGVADNLSSFRAETPADQAPPLGTRRRA